MFQYIICVSNYDNLIKFLGKNTQVNTRTMECFNDQYLA